MAKKKGRASAIVRLVIWSVVALILTATLCLFLIAPSINNWMNIGIPGVFGFNGYTYPDADTYSVGGATLTPESEDYETVKNIDIGWLAGSVKVVPSEGDEIKIYEEDVSGVEESHLLRWRLKNGTLSVKYAESGLMWYDGKDEVKHLTLSIPEDMLADMGEFKVDLVSASLCVPTLVCREVSIDTVSGGVEFEYLVADEFESDSTSGTVKVSGEVEKIDIDTVSGKATLNGEFLSVDMDSTSAGIEIVYKNSAPRSLDVDTVSGDVNVFLPETVQGFEAELDSVSGDFESDFSATVKDGKYIFGDRSFKMSFDSVSGDVTVSSVAIEEAVTEPATESPTEQLTETETEAPTEPTEETVATEETTEAVTTESESTAA